MQDRIVVQIDPAVTAKLPKLRLLVLRFGNVRMGTPSRKIEPLRDRVIAAARETLNAARDVRRIPSLAAFHDAFPEILRGARRPWLDDAFRAIGRRDPFPVQNEVIDVARILSLHYAIPLAVLDVGKVRPPLRLGIAPQGSSGMTSAKTSADLSGLPVIVDAGGPVTSPFLDLSRGAPGRTTTDVLFLAFDPVGTDFADVESRASNWLGTLTGAKLAASAIVEI